MDQTAILTRAGWIMFIQSFTAAIMKATWPFLSGRPSVVFRSAAMRSAFTLVGVIRVMAGAVTPRHSIPQKRTAMKLGFVAISLALGSAAPALASDITSGTWLRGDGQAKVRVQKCGEAYCAVNIWIKNPGDEKVGDRLVLNVKPVKPGLMEGSAFDPQRNLRFSSKITYSNESMTTSGCVLGGLLCRSVSWSKVASR